MIILAGKEERKVGIESIKVEVIFESSKKIFHFGGEIGQLFHHQLLAGMKMVAVGEIEKEYITCKKKRKNNTAQEKFTGIFMYRVLCAAGNELRHRLDTHSVSKIDKKMSLQTMYGISYPLR